MNEETVQPERAASQEEENRDHDIYRKGLRDGQRKGGAQVLAACQGAVEVFIQEIGKFSQEFAKWRPFKKWDRDDWEAAGSRLLCDLSEAMEKLQPAASDLEALLREERVKERLCVLGEHPGLCNGDTDNPERHARLCKYHQELAELEKARAEGKG